MRTPRLILSIVCLLCAAKLHAQDVSINLSIRWEDAPYIFNSDSIVSSPRLVVSYKNDSDRDLYFLKMSRGKYRLPGFPCGDLPHYIAYKERDYTAPKSQIRHHKYNGEKFVVELAISKHPNNCWLVWPENMIEEGEFEIPRIDCTLSDITEFIVKKFHGGWGDTLYPRYFDLADITEEALASVSEKNFCFLRAGETKEDVYDITALWMVEGIFEFRIINEKFRDNVAVGENLHDPSGVIYPTAKLPEKVGDYQLYSGELKYNPLTITF